MEIYDHPTFRMACQQFDLAADHLNIPQANRARLKYPKRSMTVALPIKRDDDRIEVPRIEPAEAGPNVPVEFPDIEVGPAGQQLRASAEAARPDPDARA